MSLDIAASVRARLLAQAKRRDTEFELFLVRYACERFLYRLGVSAHRDACVLKGAGLLAAWMSNPYRATRDIDFLARGPNTPDAVRGIVADVCAVECEEDGLAFDTGSIAVSPIRADAEYQGLRVLLRAYLGRARIRVQIDFGFGDAMSPGPVEIEFPTLIAGIPAPRIMVYRREVSVAEKLDAMIRLSTRNTRMKDFHDAWALSTTLDFDSATLSQAVAACFERRRMSWAESVPDVLTPAFYEHDDMQARWAAYIRGQVTDVPTTFAVVGEQVCRFFGPLRDSMLANDSALMRWPAGGPWSAVLATEET